MEKVPHLTSCDGPQSKCRPQHVVYSVSPREKRPSHPPAAVTCLFCTCPDSPTQAHASGHVPHNALPGAKSHVHHSLCYFAYFLLCYKNVVKISKGPADTLLGNSDKKRFMFIYSIESQAVGESREQCECKMSYRRVWSWSDHHIRPKETEGQTVEVLC